MKKLSLFLVALTMILFSCKPEIEKPTVVTKSVGEVTKTTAKVVGQVIADGGSEVSERGVCWNTEGAPEVIDYRTVDGKGIGTYDSDMTDLKNNTTYYVRAYAINEAGTSYGEEKTFVTLDSEEPEDGEGDENEEPEEPENPEQPENPEEPGDDPENPEQPEVTTAEITDITVNSAKCGGEVTFNGNVNVTARGICWSTSQNPTVEDNKTVNGSGIGSYTSNMTNLEHNTTYYVRAYATNEVGTAYGEEVSFKTLEKLLPVVTTAAGVTDITYTSAVSGGEVTFDGNLETTRGVCWSTTQNPTVEDNETENGSGIGSYTSYMTNLRPNTTYYFRAYAKNEVGIVYGEERSFETLEAYSPATGTANGYGYVDLGLSAKWATCNVGATSPEEYGDYFAWGETTTKETYTMENSLTNGISDIDLQVGGYVERRVGSYYDGNYLASQYDAATANWGGAWRMPNYYDMWELLTECTWEWIQTNDFRGYKVTGPSGASIFLPAAGCRHGSSLNYAGSDGYYWSSTPDEGNSYDAYRLYFNSDGRNMDNDYRYYGRSVRPVLE